VVCVLTGHGLKDPQDGARAVGLGRAVRAELARSERAVPQLTRI
jgi:threonine synthase